LHRLDIEAHGFADIVRPYVVARIDGAVRDAMAIEAAKSREEAQAKAVADAKAQAHGAKDDESLRRSSEAAREWHKALSAQGVTQ
tara:strand:- start:2972 stop:3226 length:255 start_codon:yes stop_codon:yes gene_type:complete